MKRKLRRLSSIFGIFAAITAALVPLIGIFVSGTIGIVLLKACAVLFVITMVFMIGAMLADENIVIKLTALPITYVLVMVGYIIYQLKAHVFFIGAMGGDVGETMMDLGQGVSVAKLSLMLHGGAIVLSIPLIIAAIVKMTKLSKRNNIDFSTYDTTEGTISNVVDTRTKINKVKAYRITLDIPHYQGQAYTVTKEFLVPMHMIHTVTIGKTVTLKVKPGKIEDVYIQNEYGVL